MIVTDFCIQETVVKNVQTCVKKYCIDVKFFWYNKAWTEPLKKCINRNKYLEWYPLFFVYT